MRIKYYCKYDSVVGRVIDRLRAIKKLIYTKLQFTDDRLRIKIIDVW